jgi:hypothetical protein
MQTNAYQTADGEIAVSDDELTFNGEVIICIYASAPRPTKVRALGPEHQAKYVKRLEDRGLDPDDYSVVDGHLLRTEIANDYMARIKNYNPAASPKRTEPRSNAAYLIELTGRHAFVRRPPRAEKYNAKWRLKRALNADPDAD